jgi:hypothetical protein
MSKKTIILFSVTILFLIAGMVFVLWQKEKEQQEKEQAQTQIEKQNIKEEITTELEKEIQTEKQSMGEEKDLVWYEVPESGIKFKIEKELADELVYYIEVAPDDSRFLYLRFSSRELSNLGEYCRAKHSPMGTLIKVKGSPSDYPDDIFIQNRKDRIKEFGDFFVYFEGPQSACSWPENLEILNRYMPLMRKSIGTPEKIKLIEKIDE